jgi:hypothetical protein
VIKLHSHAVARILEPGVTEDEVAAAIREGERFPAKFGREGFRRNFSFGSLWRGRRYHMKQVEVFATWEDGAWLVISVIAKYF